MYDSLAKVSSTEDLNQHVILLGPQQVRVMAQPQQLPEKNHSQFRDGTYCNLRRGKVDEYNLMVFDLTFLIP